MRKFEVISGALNAKTSPFTPAEIAECRRRARQVESGKVEAPTIAELRARGILRSPKKSRPSR